MHRRHRLAPSHLIRTVCDNPMLTRDRAHVMPTAVLKSADLRVRSGFGASRSGTTESLLLQATSLAAPTMPTTPSTGYAVGAAALAPRGCWYKPPPTPRSYSSVAGRIDNQSCWRAGAKERGLRAASAPPLQYADTHGMPQAHHGLLRRSGQAGSAAWIPAARAHTASCALWVALMPTLCHLSEHTCMICLQVSVVACLLVPDGRCNSLRTLLDAGCTS